jgi:hypothetical protein
MYLQTVAMRHMKFEVGCDKRFKIHTSCPSNDRRLKMLIAKVEE